MTVCCHNKGLKMSWLHVKNMCFCFHKHGWKTHRCIVVSILWFKDENDGTPSWTRVSGLPELSSTLPPSVMQVSLFIYVIWILYDKYFGNVDMIPMKCTYLNVYMVWITWKLQIQSGRSFHSFRNLCDPPPVLHIQCQGSAHQNQPSRIFLPHHHHHQCQLSEGVSCSTPRTSRWSLTTKDFNTLYCTHGNKSLCSLIKTSFSWLKWNANNSFWWLRYKDTHNAFCREMQTETLFTRKLYREPFRQVWWSCWQ